jgi:predicted transcriptional regulator
MTETIQTLKEDIAVLQEKLQKLEEQDPEMLLLRQGKVDIVDYNHRTHYRIEYTDSFSGVYKWFVRKLGEIPFLEEVRDVNVYALLEELYQKEVVKQKDDYPYKKYTPEETEQSLKEAFREAVKQGIVHEVDKVSDVFMNEMVEKLKGQTLYDVIADWWNDVFANEMDDGSCIDVLVSRIDKWLPKYQSAEGSQNAYVESAVEGFNDAIKQIKSKLR